MPSRVVMEIFGQKVSFENTNIMPSEVRLQLKKGDLFKSQKVNNQEGQQFGPQNVVWGLTLGGNLPTYPPLVPLLF